VLAGTRRSFLAPGSHWYDGRATWFQLRLVSSSGKTGGVDQVRVGAPAGTTVHLTVPAGTVAVIIRAVNSDGLVSNAERCTRAGELTVAWPPWR